MKAVRVPSLEVLVVALLHFIHHVAALGGTLDFIPLDSPTILINDDDNDSGYLSALGEFPFGFYSVDGVYVSTNGYFSMGIPPSESSPSIPGLQPHSLVAPYAADIDATYHGSVRYVSFDRWSPYNASMAKVSDFIESHTGDYFHGSRMMVAEWNDVPKYEQLDSITNTFQGILITDGSSSYAVFIYECGGMEWGGGVIGWQASTTQHDTHYPSGEANSNDVGCLYSDTHTALVFRLDNDYPDTCEFTCGDGACAHPQSQCDGVSDCADGSDEEGCDTLNVALTVSLSMSFLFTLLFVGIPLVFVLFICCLAKRKPSTVSTRVITPSASEEGSITSILDEDCNKLLYPPPPSYDPPSYDVATASPRDGSHVPKPMADLPVDLYHHSEAPPSYSVSDPRPASGRGDVHC